MTEQQPFTAFHTRANDAAVYVGKPPTTSPASAMVVIDGHTAMLSPAEIRQTIDVLQDCYDAAKEVDR